MCSPGEHLPGQDTDILSTPVLLPGQHPPPVIVILTSTSVGFAALGLHIQEAHSTPVLCWLLSRVITSVTSFAGAAGAGSLSLTAAQAPLCDAPSVSTCARAKAQMGRFQLGH